MNIEKKDVLKLYNLPKEVLFCKKCTISNQRPRITFDQNGVCSACNFSEHKKNESLKIDHLSLKRPGTGLFYKDIKNVLGKKLKKNLKKNHQIRFNDLRNK